MVEWSDTLMVEWSDTRLMDLSNIPRVLNTLASDRTALLSFGTVHAGHCQGLVAIIPAGSTLNALTICSCSA